MKHNVKIRYTDDAQFLTDFSVAVVQMLVGDFNKDMSHPMEEMSNAYTALSLLFKDQRYAQKAMGILREKINEDVEGLKRVVIEILGELKKMDGKIFEINCEIKESSSE